MALFKSVLDQSGIQTFIRNDLSNNGLTEMPSGLFFPTLCVVNDEDYDLAMEILKPIDANGTPPGPDWMCPQCAAEVPGNFDSCWQCGVGAAN